MLIYQMKHQTYGQMMGYVIVADNGNVIVFDGGRSEEDADLLREIVARHGNRIDLWFITHTHCDHQNAFIYISSDPRGIEVGLVCYHTLDISNVPESDRAYNDLVAFNTILGYTPFDTKIIEVGDTFSCGNLKLEVLGVPYPDIDVDIFNNSSCPVMITEEYSDGNVFKLLMLGDLGIEAGNRLAASRGRSLKADMGQMAHHGQNAAERNVYELISPAYTLWPTPRWLWENTADPEKPGQGPFKTLIVRGWMEDMGAVPITSLDKTAVIRTDGGTVTVFDYDR